MTATPLLETARLILRPLALPDAPAIQRHIDNWSIIKQLSTVVPWPYPADGAETFVRLQLEKMKGGRVFVWVLVAKGEHAGTSGEAIGVVHFRLDPSPGGNRGFWLAEPYWRQGLMTEAIEAVNDFVFGTLGVEEYIVSNVASNAGSRRVKEKTGAVFLDHIELPHNTGETRAERWVVRKRR